MLKSLREKVAPLKLATYPYSLHNISTFTKTFGTSTNGGKKDLLLVCNLDTLESLNYFTLHPIFLCISKWNIFSIGWCLPSQKRIHHKEWILEFRSDLFYWFDLTFRFNRHSNITEWSLKGEGEHLIISCSFILDPGFTQGGPM